MKNGKAPTKRQKMAMKAVGLNPNNWLIYKKIEDNLHLVHRETDTVRIIPE